MERKPKTKSKDQIFRETVRQWYRLDQIDIPRLEGRIEGMMEAKQAELANIEKEYGHLVTVEASLRMSFRDDVLEMYRTPEGVFGIRIVETETETEPETETETEITPPVAEVPEDEEAEAEGCDDLLL